MAASPWPHLLDAPVIALPLADPQAYLDRYSAPDKAGSRARRPTEAWPAPYWTIDTAMAVQTLLLAAEDAGLGALFFGVFTARPSCAPRSASRSTQLLGAIALGYPLERRARAAARRRGAGAPPAEIIHRGGW